MTDKLHAYDTTAIDVTYDKARCIHVGACIRGLPRVFDPGSRPWVMPENSTADKVAGVVEQCPSGALHYIRKDGGPAEKPDAENALRVSRNGPLFLRGQLELVEPDGTVKQETRIALCRCGASASKPFCDNSHLKVHFQDATTRLPAGKLDADRADASGPLRIEPLPDGPVQLRGNLRVLDATGTVAGITRRAAFCRCGQSGTKPFCDGSHARAGFSAD
jgi:CDGSH-type Zn-finger protein/uncharacterized Fe-S cluster protein YjdI